MKQFSHKQNADHKRAGKPMMALSSFISPSLALVAAVIVTAAVQGRAQTVTLTPSAPHNFWGGVNTSNILVTNSISVAETGGGATTNIILAVTGVNGATVFGTMSPASLTGNGTSTLTLAVTNAAVGYYPVSVNASGDAIASTGFDLFVVNQWANQATGSSNSWSVASSWSGGAAPVSGDGVYIEHTIVGPSTNVVDSSQTIQSLVCLGTADDGGSINSGVHTVIASGSTLSVLGTNGFHIGDKTPNLGRKPEYVFEGDGTLLVSNSAAQFSIISANGNNTRWLTAEMSRLANLKVHVKQVAIMDQVANQDSAAHAGQVNWVLAKTNLIVATLTDDYTAPTFNTSISYNRQILSANNGQSANAQIRLGITNAIYADSIGIGMGDANGSSAASLGGNSWAYRMMFATANNTAPTSSAVFRNTDGVSRMSLLALGVDQGLNTQIAANRGLMDLRGGGVDMLVDQIWLGQDRTNSANMNGKDCAGGLFFNWGTIDCNTLIAGNMKYTNNVGANGIRGLVLVDTNGTLVVNNNLILGKTPTDVTGFESQAALVSGQVQINNGGMIRASQISVGQFSGNNFITVNGGGTLEVSNAIASASTRLGTLTVNSGGHVVLHRNGANTLAYVTNLVASSGVIDVPTTTGAGSFTPIISYAPGSGESASFVGGSYPSGYYGINVFNNTTTHTIDVTLLPAPPKSLMWKGYVDNKWDTTTKNWLDLNTGIHTNFSTGDSVVFDDTASFFSLDVTEDVAPLQSGVADGMVMTNNSNVYAFSGVGGIRGAAKFSKYGSNNVQIGNYSEILVSVNEGSLTGSGTIGSVVLAAGTASSWSGTVLGGVVNAGSLANSGNINGGLTVQAGGYVTNLLGGVIIGSWSMETNTTLGNAGTLKDIGSPTIPTNSVVFNNGSIYGQALNISGTLEDTGAGYIGMGSALTINGRGVFIPGGDLIGTSTINEYPLNTNYANAGRIVLLTGSTNVFKVNPGINNTVVKSDVTSLGPNHSGVAYDGGTIQIINVGGAFSAGQTFPLFQNTYGGAILNAGQNSTNAYPVITPGSPGAGLQWDLSTIIQDGVLRIKTINGTPTNLVYSAQVINGGSNIVTHLSWPADYTGWYLQSQQNTLNVGLSTNWTTIGGSSFVNDMTITNAVITNTAVFYRMVFPNPTP